MATLESKTHGGYRFVIDADNFFNYATALNGKSIIRSLEIKSLEDRIATNVTIQVTLNSLGMQLTEPWKMQVGTLGNETVQAENLALEFYAELLFQQVETVPAELKIEIFEEEKKVTEVMWAIDLHSPETWLWNDATNEILAAYVQPNHPVLRDVLDQAVNILKREGEFVALSGYQVPRHVRPMVQAIYQAMVNRELTYSNPPAFWDSPGGQKIRNAQTVLDEKVGTCLDTAVLFASLLEATGLNPVIALIPGHAFVGFWTAEYFSEQREFPRWTELAISEVINAVDSGYIELFETTSICKGQSQLPYDQAIKESHARISSVSGLGINAVKSTLLNIAGCRMMRPRPIRPLPAIFKSADGTVQRIDYKPIEFSVGMLQSQLNAEGAQGASAGAVGLNVPPVVRRWLDSLLDLSGRNPLINFKKPDTCVPLLAAPELLGSIEDLLQNRQTLTLISSNAQLDERGQVAGSREAASELAEFLSKKILITDSGKDGHQTKLRKMASTAKTLREETGSNELYLALGTLNWTMQVGSRYGSSKEERQVRSPLILVPVNLISKNRGREFYLTIDEGSQIMPNFSLAEKLLRDEGIKLDNLVNLVEDESGVDVNGTFDYVRKTLANAGHLNFRIDEDAVLGFFNFSTYRLWRDLLDNWKTFEENSLVKHLINTPNQDFKDPSTESINTNLDDLVSRLPISSDASQARAVAHAMAGRTFILQGPPGTGKSQTITNLLALALSEGKRVLFVAQKKDALDVVKERLDAAGLGAFILNLHDKGLAPKAVKEQLLSVIDIAISADRVGYETARGEYEIALTPLQKYRNRLHEIGRLGESIYSALDKKLAIPGDATMEISGEFIAESDVETKERLIRSSKNLADMGPQTGIASTNPWSLSNRTVNFTEGELAELKTSLRSMRSALDAIQSNPNALKVLQNFQELSELALVKALSYEEARSTGAVDFKSFAFTESLRNAIQSLQNLKSAITSVSFNVSRLENFDVDAWITKAQEANTSFALLRGSKQGGVLKKINALLGEAITNDRTQIVPILENLKVLKTKKLQAANDLNNVASVRLDVSLNLFEPDTVDKYLAQLQKLEELSQFMAKCKSEMSTIQSLITESDSSDLKALLTFSEESAKVLSSLESDQASIDLWRERTGFGLKLAESAANWATDAVEHSFAQLTRWVTLMQEAKPFKEAGLGGALRTLLSGEVNYIDAPNAFLRGYYERLMQSLIVERGFNTFEAMTINNHIKNLDNSHSEIKQRLPRITGAELLSRRGFDSSMKVGAIGDLVATLKQPRSKVPIRTMLAKHWGIINKITPCVLAVPDACVRFIDPALPPFDLVVFDEASQIRVANSIGAIGRGKAVIVVGDSKQMPPTSVAQTKLDENESIDDDEVMDGLLSFDMESILDHCENARVPDIMLNWHYRSEDESLIAFSNKKYYEGRLNSFPSPSTDKSFKGLSFEYVQNGQFVRKENLEDGKKGTNPAEIDAILKYLSKRLKDPELKNDSIGIVTFNKPQMDEIRERLTDSPDPDIQRAMSEGVGGEEIFIKNLESVQGSERDVILFSVAFSKNQKGDLPLNFGPLTNAGGERRLNVAITRARKQVRVFCSFKPDELLNRNSTATGVSHLAQFLKMANKEDDESTGIYTIRESHPDRTRRVILQALRDAGLNAVEEVGLSDFKVDIAIYDPKDSTKAVLGILLDGLRWNTRETVSDRDCLSVTLLRDRMGWPAIERIWLASWLRNPKDEVARIKSVYEKILAEGPVKVKKPEKQVQVEPIFTQLSEAQINDGENPIDRLLTETDIWQPMSPFLVGNKGHLDYLYDPRVKKAIEQIAEQITEHEGPVSPDRFAKFIGACFGLSRMVANRVSAINALSLSGHQRDDEGFIYPKSETFFTFTKWRRGSEGSNRAINEISLCEISNAMKSICEVAQGVRPEQLNKEVSRLFGITKVSSTTNDRLNMALNFGLTNGRLSKDGEYIQAK